MSPYDIFTYKISPVSKVANKIKAEVLFESEHHLKTESKCLWIILNCIGAIISE
jgi:hypothetical protein